MKHQAPLFALAVVALAACTHGGLTLRETHRVPAPSARAVQLEGEDLALASAAVRYLRANRLSTGLVSSAASFPATTMWDAASQLGGMLAARELGLMTDAELHPWLTQALASLARIPLYRGELPNKAYNAERLYPTAYGDMEKARELGFSALDLGRMALWLRIISDRYPEHASACAAVTARWKLSRLSRDGQLMGTELQGAEETWNQEGRLGYEQYGAYGLAKLGVVAEVAADPRRHVKMVVVDGLEIPSDERDMHDSVAHNYVTSEPFVLDGIETGFASLPAEWAGRLLLAQTRRSRRTGELTAWSEDNLESAPWFVYNSIYVDGQAWTTLDTAGHDAASKRGSSVKAAVGWHVLFRTPDTERTYKGLRWLADPAQGVFAGYYEETQRPNRALTLNTNGIVLEALLFARVGVPLEQWARHGR